MTYLLDQETGYFISEKHRRIAEIIKEYQHDLELAWIPPDKREPGDKPFAVIHRPVGNQPYVVFHLDETEVDERVLARLWSSDNTNHHTLNYIEALENAREAVRMKEQMDRIEEEKELIASIIATPKSVYRHNGVEYRQ